MFRRRKRAQEAGTDEVADVEQGPEEQAPEPTDGSGGSGAAGSARPSGPWDVQDAPQDEVARIDLGGLRVPVPPDTEVRVDVDPQGQVVAATLVQAGGQMQVNAFAAPRTEGIWDEVAAEIAASLVESGGASQTVEGPWGAELRAAVPTELPGQGLVLAPARFVGVDGPRWFLRAVLTGPAAVDRSAAAGLEAALRDVVVVRGNEAMAVRDPLPLRLPREVVEQAAAEQAAAEQEADEESRALQMPERGPEITETR